MNPNEALGVLLEASGKWARELALEIIPAAEGTPKLFYEDELDDIQQAIQVLSPGKKDTLVLIPRKGPADPGLNALLGQLLIQRDDE